MLKSTSEGGNTDGATAKMPLDYATTINAGLLYHGRVDAISSMLSHTKPSMPDFQTLKKRLLMSLELSWEIFIAILFILSHPVLNQSKPVLDDDEEDEDAIYE
jgi:hypothetical protein